MKKTTLLLSAIALLREAIAVEYPMYLTQRSFSDSLTSALHQNANDCSSSLGVSMMLSLAHPAANGSTALQMCQKLGFPCAPTNETLAWNETAARLTSRYDGLCEQFSEDSGDCTLKRPTLEIANSIWVDTGTNLYQPYLKVVGSYLIRTDFQDNGAGDAVNEWVEGMTHGLVDSIIEPGPIDADLVAVNVLYLNATWENTFDEEKTNEDIFYANENRDGALSAKRARFMHKVEQFPYSDTALPGFQLVKLPFTDESLSMLIALPMGDSGDPTMSTAVLDALPMLSDRFVALAMPKFQFSSEYGDVLKEALISIGLTAPFDPNKGFCLMFPDACAVLEVIKQKTFIDVHEKGTEAAAVNVGKFYRIGPSNIILFMSDHPFRFFICEESERLVLFEGHLRNFGIPIDAQ